MHPSKKTQKRGHQKNADLRRKALKKSHTIQQQSSPPQAVNIRIEGSSDQTGFKQAVDQLTKQTSPANLVIMGDKLTREDRKRLLAILETHKQILKLTLNQFDMGDEVIESLVMLICTNRTLTELVLFDSALTQSGGEKLALAMQDNYSLHRFFLFGNHAVDPEDLKRIQQCTKSNLQQSQNPSTS